MNIALAFNRQYIKYAIVMLTSLCDNNRCHNDIYILHRELKEEDIQFIENALNKFDVSINDINIASFFENLDLPTKPEWALERYYRLLLSDRLPVVVSRILYIDVDTIVHESIEEMYNLDFEGNDILAALNSNNTNELDDYEPKVIEMLLPLYGEEFKYFNSDIMLLNIEQMRNNNSFNTYLEAMEKWNYEMVTPDQDILNYVHYNKVKYLDWQQYNLYAFIAHQSGWDYETVKTKNKIIHYAGAKPWNWGAIHFDIEKFWWEYAAKTPLYLELMEEFLNKAMENSYLEEVAIGLCQKRDELSIALKEANDTIGKFGF